MDDFERLLLGASQDIGFCYGESSSVHCVRVALLHVYANSQSLIRQIRQSHPEFADELQLAVAKCLIHRPLKIQNPREIN